MPLPVLEEITANAWDERLSDHRLEIRERAVTRAVRRDNGRINVTVTQKDDQTFVLGLNFDLQSDNVDQLLEWISIPEADLRHEVERIIHDTLQIRREEVIHG